MKSRRIFVILVLGLLVTPVLAESESQIVDEVSHVFSEGVVAATTTIFSDSFSGSHPGSWSIGHDGGGGNYAWAWPNNYAHEYSNPSGGQYWYPDDLHVYMERRNVSLSGYSNASLFFNYIVDTEAFWDYFTVNVRDQSGSWHEVWRESGTTDPLTWSNRTLNLDAFAGQTGLYIQFRFDSDGSVSGSPYDGVFIDNVTLTAIAAESESGYIVSASPSSFTGGVATTVTVRVRNTGDSDDMIIEWDSKPSGWSISPGYRNPYMTSGSYYNATFTVTPPVSGGSGTIVWKFYDDDILSNDLLDTYYQSVSAAAQEPDFIITDLDTDPPSPVCGQPFTVSVTVKNQGPVAGNAGYLDMWINKSSTASCGEQGDDRFYVGTLNAGQSYFITFFGGALSAAPSPGGKTLRAFIDSGCITSEEIESNNQSTHSYTVIENISPPTSIGGVSSTYVDKSENYTASGASSSGGHSLQYQFDWGDGNFSGWGSATQSHSYGNSSTYNIKARARCASHPTYFSSWSGTLKSVSVSWVQLNISVSPGGAGSVTKNPDRPVGYSYNETVWLTAIANSGYTFDTPLWSGDASGSSNPVSVTMDSSKNITANFLALPDIRIEPLTLDFESLVATVGGTATDSSESINNATLVSGSVNDSNDIDSPYYYYYFDKKKPLILDVNQIALKRASGSTQTLLQGRFEKFGISDADLEPWPIAGWTLANVPASSKSAEGIEGLLDQIIGDDAADFVSPVFIGDDGGPVIITSTIFVGFNENMDVDQAEAILSELEVDAVVEPNYANMKGVYRLSNVGRNGFEVLQKANSLAELLEVKFAEPDMIITVDSLFVPNDPGFSQCWGIHNAGQSGGTPDMDMDGPEAWDLSTGDSSIIIVVLDNGVQQDHPDIHQIAGADFTGEGGGGGPVNECDDHGTAVAGCISATINNNLGTVGIAPNCVVASARVSVSNIPCDGRGTFMWSWIVNALDWAETIGARVTNNSNSYDSTSSLLTTKYAQTRDNGMVHFASAGNDYGDPVSYPASLPTVNAVAAVDRNGDLASFSNFGTGLAFSAPGQSIYTTDRTGSDGYSSGDYTTINGTSFASPYTAGVAALVLSVNPSLDTAAVEQILQLSAVDLGPSGYDTTFGWGFVNAFEAIKQASEAQDFIIYNDGTGTLTVSGITKEGGSTWLGFTPVPPFDVDGGNSQLVTVSVDPTGLSPDIYSDRLLVYSNDPDENPYPGGVYVNLTVTCVSTTIEQPPQDITICEGQDAVFDIVATGSEPLQYQWKKDGSDVGIDSSELTLYNMQLADDGSEIWCEVTNACGSVVVSTSAFLTVYPWPTVTVNPNPDQLNAAWALEGPNSYTYSSNGDETITEYLEFGSYTITWSTIPSWNTPLPNPDTKNLSVGNSINFIGNYELIGDLYKDYYVDFKDLEILVMYWLTFEPSINMSGDDFIDFSDFAVFAEHWHEGLQ